MINQSVVKPGIAGVSRIGFSAFLTNARRATLMNEFRKATLTEVFDCFVAWVIKSFSYLCEH